MALVVLSSGLELAPRADNLRKCAFAYHVRQVSVQTLVESPVAAFVDAWNALNTAFPSVL